MKKVFKIVGVLLLIGFIITAFLSDEEQTPFIPPERTQVESGTLNKIPLLPDGQHVGIQKGFNSKNTRAGSQAIRNRFAEAVEAGMQVHIHHIDWQAMETSEGEYDMRELREGLDEIKAQGLRPAIKLAVVDSTSINVPDYWRGDGDLDLRDGMRLDDPQFLAAHNRLMDRLVPLALEYDAWAMILLNEADNHVKENQDTDLVQEYASFLAQARDYIHSINSDMAVGATLTAYVEENYDLVRPMIDESDFASYNFYCAGGTTDGDEYGGSIAYEELRERFVNHQLPAAGGKEIIIQEMGCATGYADNQMDTAWFGFDGQAEYFRSMQRLLSEQPSIRAAFQFQLIDSNAEDDQKYYGDLLLAEGMEPESVIYLLEGLGTLGMLEYQTGNTKPGWDVFVDLIRSVY